MFNAKLLQMGFGSLTQLWEYVAKFPYQGLNGPQRVPSIGFEVAEMRRR
jgi:hypothetical protein